jgi:hypothetical protein
MAWASEAVAALVPVNEMKAVSLQNKQSKEGGKVI